MFMNQKDQYSYDVDSFRNDSKIDLEIQSKPN